MTDRKTTASDFVEVLESAFLRALAEPSRLDVLKVLLLHGPADIGTIASHLPRERSVVSRHLKVLRDAGAVRVERAGRHRVYAIDGQAILGRFSAMLAQARALAASCCPPQPPARAIRAGARRARVARP